MYDQYFLAEPTLFHVFECFYQEIYWAIISSIILTSLFKTLYDGSLKSFLTTFWSYLSVLLSDCYTIKVDKLLDRLLMSGWLFSCTILLAAFSGQLRDQMMNQKLGHKIESWEDLYEWKHLNIQTFTTQDFSDYLDKYSDSPMANDFNKRTERLKDEKFISHELSLDRDLDYKGLINGKTAFVFDGHLLNIIKTNLEIFNLQENIDFHISEFGGLSQPYFNAINKRKVNESLALKYNLV